MSIALKVCGVNDASFAAEAERLGADYLGFIFAEGSPRQITRAQAQQIVAGLTGRSRRVAVFTTTPVDEAAETAAACGCAVVQLHRRATEADVQALRGKGFEVWTLAGGACGDGVLFDSTHGDGETAFRRGPYKAILAGGISEANLSSARALAPDVIDVSGSLESSRGVKSIARLQSFMTAARVCGIGVNESCPLQKGVSR